MQADTVEDMRVERQCIGELEASDLEIRRRRVLLSKLKKVGTDSSVPVLRANLHHADLQSRVRAVFALGHVGTDKAIEGLMECVERETGPPFTFAVRELGRLGARRAIPALIGALDGSSKQLSEGDKRVTIYALTQMPHRSEVSVLSAALREGNARTRRAAARALAQIRAPESHVALEQAVQSLSWTRGIQARRALRAKAGSLSE